MPHVSDNRGVSGNSQVSGVFNEEALRKQDLFASHVASLNADPFGRALGNLPGSGNLNSLFAGVNSSDEE